MTLLSYLLVSTSLFLLLVISIHGTTLLCNDPEPCAIPQIVSCPEFIENYRFIGSCCSLSTDTDTGLCVITISNGHCFWEPEGAQCDTFSFHCPPQGIQYVSTNPNECPPSEFDPFATNSPTTSSSSSSSKPTMSPTTTTTTISNEPTTETAQPTMTTFEPATATPVTTITTTTTLAPTTTPSLSFTDAPTPAVTTDAQTNPPTAIISDSAASNCFYLAWSVIPWSFLFPTVHLFVVCTNLL